MVLYNYVILRNYNRNPETEETLTYECTLEKVPKEQFLWEMQDRKRRINFCNSNVKNYSYIYGVDCITAYFPWYFNRWLMKYFLKKEIKSKCKEVGIKKKITANMLSFRN